jgi:transposase
MISVYNLEDILNVLDPFKKTLEGVVVESTFNWYWLVDGLQDSDYKVHLANPSAIQQYEGIKYTDDKSDSFWLARMLKLNILPEGYIYPRKERSIRDTVRRRTTFVQQRSSHILSLQSMISRNLGIKISNNEIKKMKEEDADGLFNDPYLAFMAKNNIETINFLKEVIYRIENKIMPYAKLRKEFEMLLTISGIGKILAFTIMLEVGDINRFPKAGNYASYCRCVKSEKLTNGKKKGKNNSKNGNPHLSWAYVEAANFMKRHCKKAQRFFQRKEAKTNKIVATKALSNKIAKASYYVMRDQVSFDEDSLFS